MKLIGAIASPYVTRVVMFARIKGLDLPLEDAPGGSPRSEEYLALTPIGKIPSLDVDGRILAESEVICEYLEDAYPEKSGFPDNNLDKATSRLISRIVDVYIAPEVGPMFRMLWTHVASVPNQCWPMPTSAKQSTLVALMSPTWFTH